MSTTQRNDLIRQFKELSSIIQHNTYVRDTTNKLQHIIQDAEAQTQIMFVGKERVGKSTMINALLGRNLFSTNVSEPTQVNIFLKYDENERIEVVFYDGYVTTFGLNHLHMIVNAQVELAEMMREHIQYIQVFLKNELLKQVTLIDTHSFEVVHNESIYFSEGLLGRIDEIIWVMRGETPTSDEEITYLRRIASRFMKPHIVLNAIDEIQGSINAFIQQEASRYGQYVESFQSVSARLAMEARLENNPQKLIDSNFTAFAEFIKGMASNEDRKEQHNYNQLKHWLSRFRKELELIISREPYISAVKFLKKHEEEKALEFSKEQRDLAIIKAYEEDYKNTAQLFKTVQTLYQLLQAIANHLILRDASSELFEEIASRYLQELRHYRNLLRNYEAQYKACEKYIKTISEENHHKIIQLTAKADREAMENTIIKLNSQRDVLLASQQKIRGLEQELIIDLEPLTQHLNTKVKQQLQLIFKQVVALNEQRNREFTTITSSQYKLKEFDRLVDAQQFVITQLNETLQSLQQTMPEETYQDYKKTIEFIHAIEFEHLQVSALEVDEVDKNLTKPIVVTFEYDYPFMPLSIQPADIISIIDDVPPIIQLASLSVQ